MHPTLTIGPFAISGFAAMVFLGAVVGIALCIRQAYHVPADWRLAFDIAAWSAMGGLLGSKIYYLIQFPEHLENFSLTRLRGIGQVWYGGLITGIAVAVWRTRRLRLPLSGILDQGAPAIAAGHAIGRVGCLLAGDDYGFSTSLPWGIPFPHGAPPSTAGYLRDHGDKILASIPDAQIMAVHPTMVYESIGLLLLTLVLWPRSHTAYRPWSNVAIYAVGYGSLRFAIEFLRPKDDMLSVGLTVAQLVSAALVASGVFLFVYSKRYVPATPREQLAAALA